MDYKQKYFRYKNKLQQLGATGSGGNLYKIKNLQAFKKLKKY